MAGGRWEEAGGRRQDILPAILKKLSSVRAALLRISINFWAVWEGSWRHFGLILGTRRAQGWIFINFWVHFRLNFGSSFALFLTLFGAPFLEALSGVLAQL